ncbi:hypothetical protein Mapa_002116 [Marchantia paleacea]|nr:hypothetical protein Mapa_002116 [Marchantia paleacea]
MTLACTEPGASSIFQVCWVPVGVIAVVVSVYAFLHLFRFLQLLRTHISSGKGITWRNKYPSLEDLHALFDRGDVMVAAVLVASTLQLAHGDVAKVLEAHSMFKTDPWRRLVRTLTFISITVRANSAQRSQIVAWLNRLHGNIRLFEFETNTFVLATISYGLACAHQVLGCANDVELDVMVSAIMNMANKLNPEDRLKSVPTSLSAVEQFLSKQISFDPVQLQKLFEVATGNAAQLLNKRSSNRMSADFGKSLSWIQLSLYASLCRAMSLRILAPKTSSDCGLVLNLARTFQPLWYHLHYTACPHILTLDGFFGVLFDCDPSLQIPMNEVYHEIFGGQSSVPSAQRGPGRSMTAHLPQLPLAGASPAPERHLTPSSFLGNVREHFMCAYFRARLAGSSGRVPQHLGVIMDGNRRYSRQNRLGSVIEGHRMGARKLLQFMSWSFSVGIHNLTLWALSDDNLKRGRQELDPLFAMMADFIREIMMGDTPISVLEVRFRVVGDRSLLPAKLNGVIDAAEKATQGNKRFNMQLALGYGGQSEVVRAVKLAVKTHALEQSTTIEEALSNFTAKDVSKHTYTSELGLPPIDAILRTSGENRLSGFALWESQAAEISFVKPNWPGMTQSTFLQSIVSLSERNRRHGA